MTSKKTMWVVWNTFADKEIQGVFHTRAAAKKWIGPCKGLSLQEASVEPLPLAPPGMRSWDVHFGPYGHAVCCHSDYPAHGRSEFHFLTVDGAQAPVFKISLWARSAKAAVRLALERAANRRPSDKREKEAKTAFFATDWESKIA